MTGSGPFWSFGAKTVVCSLTPSRIGIMAALPVKPLTDSTGVFAGSSMAEKPRTQYTPTTRTSRDGGTSGS